MAHVVDTSGKTLDISDVCSNFDCLKISVMQKMQKTFLTCNMNKVTIGPNSILSNEKSKSENIEDENNSCSVSEPVKNNKIADNSISKRNRLTFSIKKILHENEVQRKELVWKKMEKRRQEMERTVRASKEEIKIYQSILALNREQQKKEELARLEAEEERYAQQTEMRRKHEQMLLAQRIQEQKEKLEQEAEEERKKVKEREEAIEKIQIDFNERWQNFKSLTESYKNEYSIEPYIDIINELNAHMKTIGNSARSGKLSSTEIAELVVQNSEEILRLFTIEIDRINAIHDAKVAQKEYELKQAEIQTEIDQLQNQNTDVTNETQQPEIPISEVLVSEIPVSEIPVSEIPVSEIPVSEIPETEVTDSPSTEAQVQETFPISLENQPVVELYKFVDKESLNIYIQSQEFLEEYEESYADLIKNNENKKFKFECQKAINIPVNAISAISRDHLMDKYEKLRNLLSGNFSQDSTAQAFCKNTLAKKIVNQGETLVSSKPEMAFAIAAVVVALWNDNQQFGELLLANLRVTCPFIVPACFPQREGQSNEDYYRSLGYKYSEDGTVEKQDKFLKRTSGFMRLYASIIVTKQRRGITQPHPHGLQNAWRWLAAIMNNEPRPEMSDIFATLLLDMLEVAGNALWTSYPKQFPKLLSAMITDYYPLMGKIGGIGGGPMSRLEEFLKKCLFNKSIAPPDGELQHNFW